MNIPRVASPLGATMWASEKDRGRDAATIGPFGGLQGLGGSLRACLSSLHALRCLVTDRVDSRRMQIWQWPGGRGAVTSPLGKSQNAY